MGIVDAARTAASAAATADEVAPPDTELDAAVPPGAAELPEPLELDAELQAAARARSPATRTAPAVLLGLT
jgi:hypothetical protein